MTEIEQVKALVELDGLRLEIESNGCKTWFNTQDRAAFLPPYLTSYDAIIPLIQQQPEFASGMMNDRIDFTMTPSQLCEVLLRATGKWKD